MTRHTAVTLLLVLDLLASATRLGARTRSEDLSQAGSAIPIHGQVLSDVAGPLAGARVDLVPALDGFELLRRQLERRLDLEPAATARSGADGRFTLEAPGAGLWRLRVQAPGHVGLRAFEVALTHRVELDPARLPRDVGGRLRVVDAEGRPVAGAGVWAGSASRDLWQGVAGIWRAAPRIAWTDAIGRATIPRLAGETLKLEVWSPAADAVVQAQMVDAATVTLPPPGRRRTVEVRDATGGPVAGVLVSAGARTWPLGLVADDGRWPVPSTGDPTPVVVFHPDGRHRMARWTAAGPEPAVLTLPRIVTVTGRVADVEDRAVGGALVWPAHHASGFTSAGADGVFELRVPAREEMRIEARAPGFLPARRATAGDRRVLLVLERAAEIQGRVVDAGGRPLPGTGLEARRVGDGFQAPAEIEAWATADTEGSFRLAGLRPGASYRLSAARDGYATAEVEAEAAPPAAPGPGLRLVLRPGRAAFGFVRDLDERPLSGVEVRLRPAGAGPRSIGVPAPSEETVPQDDPWLAVTGVEGRFETRDVPARRLDVTARGRGLAPLTVRGLELPPGLRPVDLGTLYLEPGARVEGRVLDPDGAPLAGAEIWSASSSGRPPVLAFDRPAPPAALSDAAGRFAVEDLAPGLAVDLWVGRDGFLPAVLTGIEAPSARPIEVELRRAATLAGRVVDADGRAIEGAEVSARIEAAGAEPPVSGTAAAVTDGAGRFELADVAPGRLRVDAFAEGFQASSEQTFGLAAGERLEQAVFVLERGAALEGWVSDHRGDPVAGARVLSGRHGASTDADGAYRLAGLPPGSARVEVRHEAYNRLERTVEIEPGSQRADFELIGGHAVAGRVIDDSGLPVEGAVLELDGRLEPSLEPRLYTRDSAGDGGFHWPGVANGRYRLLARKAGYVTARLDAEVEIDGAGVEDLELRLGTGATISGRVLGLSFEELAGVAVQARRGDRRLTGSVDYEGRYRVVDAGAGDWLVIARLPGGGRQAQARVVLEEGIGEVERDLEFGAGVTLTGSVVYGETPLAGAAVTLAGADVAVERAVGTDFEGRFLIADLPRGGYRLSVTEPGLRLVHNQDLALDADREVVVEIATARIVGEVRAASGEPLADALLRLQQLLGAAGSRGSLFTAASGLDGRFLLERLTSGRYRLSVQRDGYRPLERELEVPSSGAVDLPLVLEPTPGLEVMARLASGRAPRLLTLVALDGGGRAALRASRVLDAEGFARFASFPEGTWDLLVSAPGSALLRTRVSVPGEPLAAMLADAGPLHVRVPDLVESDAVATLSVLGADQRPFQRLATGGELERSWRVVGGSATVEGLPAGAWTLLARSDDGRAWSGTAVTTGGPGVVVELVR